MENILTFPTHTKNIIRNVLAAFGGSILISCFANISVPLFFTPVPLVFQNNIVLFLACLLGKRGVASTALFILYGCLGFPVFAGGSAGISVLMGPTGGYIIGYLVASYLVAHLSEKLAVKTPLKCFLIMSLGSFVIMTLGCFNLGFWVGFKNVLFLGVFPFIPGNFIKTLLASHLTGNFKWEKN